MQQATADQAFTNAKAAGDVNGMTAALIYRALERNTGKVGLASVSCTSIQAVNPEIAAIQQHQDPASTGAAATNKAITLELAKQIASIGGTATDALKSGTFAPGNLDDDTGKGNSCDDANDPVGCIFSQSLLVEDATVDEINAAVTGTSTTSNNTSTTSSTNSTSAVPAVNSSIVSVADSASVSISTVTMMMTITQLQTDCAVATAPVDAAAAAAAATASSPPMMALADVSSVVSAMMADSTVSMDVSSVVSAVMAGQTSVVSTDVTSMVSAAMASETVAAVAATVASTTAVSSASASVDVHMTSADCSDQIASALAAAGMATSSAPSNVSTSSISAAAASSSVTFANTTAPSGNSSLDLGSCANPTIIFANGLDGRNEPAFAPADEMTFTHGSALGIKVITDFICQQLQTKCKASQASIDACNQGATAAQGSSGQAAADAFNAALGF